MFKLLLTEFSGNFQKHDHVSVVFVALQLKIMHIIHFYLLSHYVFHFRPIHTWSIMVEV